MTTVEAVAPEACVWTFRVARDHPLRLAALGIALAAGFVAGWLAMLRVIAEVDLAALPRWGPGSWTEVGIRAAMLGYTLTLAALGLRAAERQAGALRPAIPEQGPEVEDALAWPLRVGRSRLRLAGCGGVLAMLVLGFSMAPVVLVPYPPGAVFWLVLFGWLVGRALTAHLHAARALSSVGERWVEIDLLDLRPLQPLVRFGLRLVLLWAIWFAIMAAFWLGPESHWSNALGLLPLLAVAVAALILPVRGVHGRIRAVKRAELARVTEAIRQAREGLLDAPPGRESPRLANLIAYRSLVEDVREWPFDVSTLLRFTLYVMLGVGSWLGAALVERVLGRVLG